MKIVGSRTLRAAWLAEVDLYELASLSKETTMVPWSKIDILGRYTYYRSAFQAERRVAKSLSKIAMQ